MSVEKLTLFITAVFHGESEAVIDSETFEAETKEELGEMLVNWMREAADEFEDEMQS